MEALLFKSGLDATNVQLPGSALAGGQLSTVSSAISRPAHMYYSQSATAIVGIHAAA